MDQIKNKNKNGVTHAKAARHQTKAELLSDLQRNQKSDINKKNQRSDIINHIDQFQ